MRARPRGDLRPYRPLRFAGQPEAGAECRIDSTYHPLACLIIPSALAIRKKLAPLALFRISRFHFERHRVICQLVEDKGYVFVFAGRRWAVRILVQRLLLRLWGIPPIV